MKPHPIVVLPLAVVSSCASPQRRLPPEETGAGPTARFLHVLQTGGTLFGLRTGCDEWHVTPASKEESTCHRDACVSGRLESGIEEGKIYGFTYTAVWGDRNTVLSMASRGSWHAAPGFVFDANDPATPGYATIGSATMCVETVGVGDSARAKDAVLIGHETWYLTKESCTRERPPARVSRGCSDSRSQK